MVLRLRETLESRNLTPIHRSGLPDCGLQHLPVRRVRYHPGGGPRRLARLLLLLQPDNRAPREGSHRLLRQRLERPGQRETYHGPFEPCLGSEDERRTTIISNKYFQVVQRRRGCILLVRLVQGLVVKFHKFYPFWTELGMQ